MMMMHHNLHQHYHPHPTVDIPSGYTEDPMVSNHVFSPQTCNYISALQRYLPAARDLHDSYGHDSEDYSDDEDNENDSFSCDEFRMYEFKVRKCPRGRSHDWTDCPYAHPGEKARRRDPRKYHYSGSSCPDFRRGSCRKGDACELAHGVFESWLHPTRYRTQPCKDGPHCARRVCFFAHSPLQLRAGPVPLEDSFSLSPPMSPGVVELMGAMRGLRVCGSPMGSGGSPMGSSVSPRFGFFTTGEREEGVMSGSGNVMERVESGKGIRARMYEKLCQENLFGGEGGDGNEWAGLGPRPDQGPDLGWVSELVK